MTSDPTPKAVVVPANVLEAIAHNLCSLHGFDPGFVMGQARFAMAVIAEYERANPGPEFALDGAGRIAAPQASLPPVEGVREAVARLAAMATAYENVDHEDWAAMMPPDVAKSQKADAAAIRKVLAALSPVPTGGGKPVMSKPKTAEVKVVPSGWRTMDSAPKDGTKFDAWDRDGRIADVFWSDIQDAFCTDGDYGPEEPSPLAFFPAPTHWMPTPSAPDAVSAAAEPAAWLIGHRENKDRTLDFRGLTDADRKAGYFADALYTHPASDQFDTERMRALVETAFIAGATAVHEDWTRNPGMAPSGDPEFDEAARDYARAALAEKAADK